MDQVYQPAVPTRWDGADALKSLAPNDPVRTLVAMHQSIQPLAQVIENARATIDADTTKSPEGRLLAKQEAFGKHVAEKIQSDSQPLRLVGLRVAEQSKRLVDDAIKGATVSENRMLTHAAWLRDLPDDVKGRLLLAAVADGDAETMAAMLAAPRAWNICTPLQREKAQEALTQMHDPERAALLRDTKILLQAVAESHESLARHGRKALNIGMAPAKAA